MRTKYFSRITSTLSGMLLLVVGTAASAGLPTVDSQGKELPSLAPMLEKVTPAVVNIATRSRSIVRDNPLLRDPFFRRFFGVPDQPQKPKQSLGSGVVVDAKHGYVLTNHHVIDGAAEITVTLRDGRVLEAELVGSDPEADVAVIEIPAENLTALPMADSDKLRVGDFVVAIGNPFGLGQTVTSGIVSALGRSGLGIEGYEDFIQTDASINPGNSGGALVNLRGELVGVNTAIVAPGGGNVGIGFAIPVNMASELMEQLVEYGEIRRGRLGVSAQTLTPELAKAFGLDWRKGAVVAKVETGSAADRAGLRVGDVVVEIGGRDVKNAADFRNAVGLVRAGDDIKIQAIRDGETLKLKARIDAPANERFNGGELSHRLDGAVFGSISEKSPWHGKVEGLQILDVIVGSVAWDVGLRKGDVIVSVNRIAVTSREEMEKALKVASQGVLLNLRRGNRALFVVLQ